MGRAATKAVDSIYYQARMRAAKWNDALSSRAGAAAVFHVSPDVMNDIERMTYKCTPVDMVVAMADEYNAPELLNYYCLHECPIGKQHSLSEEVLEVDRVTVKLLKSLNASKLDDMKEKLLDIAEDGVISEDELDDLEEILSRLNEIGKSTSELKIITERALKKNGRKSRKADGDS